jgi:hypothetical protein
MRRLRHTVAPDREPTIPEQRCVVAFGVWIGLQAAKVIHELYGGGDYKGPPYPAHPAVLVLEASAQGCGGRCVLVGGRFD